MNKALFQKGAFILVAVLILCASGCSAKNGGTDYVFDNYSFHCAGEQSFIQIKSQTVLGTSPIGSQLGVIGFDSIEEFADAVLNGKLTEEQLIIAQNTFPKDEKGNIKTVDLTEIYIMNTPDGLSMKGVSWQGPWYGFAYSFDNEKTVNVNFVDPDSYQQLFENQYSIFDNPLVSDIRQAESVDGRDVYYCTTSQGDLKRIYYVLYDGDAKYSVAETYRIRMNDPSLECSETEPSDVRIFCEERESRFIIYTWKATGPLTDSWIKSFHAEPYRFSIG